MINTFSFKTKLLFICIFMAAVSVVISGISFVGLEQVSTSYKRVTNIALPSMENLNEMFLAYRSIRINLRSLGLSNLSEAQAHEYTAKVHEQIAKYEAASKAYTSVEFQPGEKELYDAVNDSWVHFKGIGERVLTYQVEGTPESKEKMNQIFLHDCPEAAKKYTSAVEALKDFHIKFSQNVVGKAEDKVKSTNTLMVIISAIGILIGLFLGFTFSTIITKSISSVAKRLAENATEVTHSSEKIAHSSQSLSEATTEQAASLQETAASLEEITAMINKASEGANSAATNSQASFQKAEDGREAVEKMMRSMDEISQSNEMILSQVNESNRQMNDIVSVIREIGNKTKVINEIVFQTKLLSFNASVEAARAGEHGKGFAVVAEEVGSLAQMSGNAAKEITDLLDSSVQKVEKIVQNTKAQVETLIANGKEKIDSGVGVARDCSDLLNEIVQNVSKVSQLSQEISQANKEQSLGVSEINKAMAQLDSVTQQNSSASGEAANSASELAGQANSLKNLVHDLQTIIGGNAKTQSPEPTTSHQVEFAPKKTKSEKIKSAELQVVSRNNSGFGEDAA